MKRFEFINKRLREENEAKAYINNIDETMLEYHRVFAKRIKPVPPEPDYQIFIILRRLKKMVNYYLL